jgi:hypothetical protein
MLLLATRDISTLLAGGVVIGGGKSTGALLGMQREPDAMGFGIGEVRGSQPQTSRPCGQNLD